MKIVCDACQAKYSIADEKVQGKAFKIRCKKCGHIIVVRQGADKPAAAAESKPAPAADQQGVWYIVVEGEQVGPLAETDIAGRLSRGEINPDTLVWKDGLADWVKISTVPELSGAASAQAGTASSEPPAEQTPPPAAPIPARRRSSARMQVAKETARSSAPAEDVFAKPASLAPASVDLFSPSAAMQSPMNEPASAPFAFGAAAAPEPVTQQAPASNGAGQSPLTGQRNENSVLFSLSNLEALAVPSSTSARPPSTSGTTEGSGLIDIRSMAARTIGQTGRGESPNAMDSLPTFSTPQFSPVAPVLLPMAPSGPPKWVYPVLGVLGLGIVALGFGIYKVVSAPPPAPPPQIVIPAPAAGPVAAPAAAAAAPAAPAAAASPEAAKPGAAEDKAGDDKSASDKKKPASRGGKTASKSAGEGSARPAGDSSKKAANPEPAPTPTAAAPKPAGKKTGSIEDLLDQVGTKKSGGEPKQAKAPSAAPLPPLSQSDIVNAMKGVQPRVKECFNQYKQAGIANVSISVAKGGRVASSTVSGKFAGTPSGSCVEAAAKTAKFPPCEAMSFPWPFQLH